MNANYQNRAYHRLWPWHQATDEQEFQVYAYFDQLTHYHRVHRWQDFLQCHAQDWQGKGRTYAGHSGTDFILPVGTAVKVMAFGIVTKIHTDARGGLTVFVDHGGGIATSYRHLQTISQSCSATLERGEIIGLSGDSGLIRWSGGMIPPHLHVTLWVDGLPTDPYRNLDQPDGVSYWTEDNEPRFPSLEDTQWDFAGRWLFKPREEIAQYLAMHHSIAWVNFSHHFWRLVPTQLTVRDINVLRPRLTLPLTFLSKHQ